MPLYSFASLAVGVAVLSIGLYHAAFVGPRFASLAASLRGDGADVDGGSLAVLRAATSRGFDGIEQRLRSLETLARSRFVRLGFVRFNAFADVGSELSFALALLSGEGDGVVLTSIYSREETRTYGKAVKNFAPAVEASPEESAAIANARGEQSRA